MIKNIKDIMALQNITSNSIASITEDIIYLKEQIKAEAESDTATADSIESIVKQMKDAEIQRDRLYSKMSVLEYLKLSV